MEEGEVVFVLDIWDEMKLLERRVDDLLRGFMGPRGWITFPPLPTGLRRPFMPATDVRVRDGDLFVEVELPRIDPERDIKVTLADGELVIRGERKRTEEVKEEDYYRAEFAYGAFERRVPVPPGTREKDVEARYRDGVLEVVVHGAAAVEAPTAKAIPVRSVKEEKKGKAA